MDSAGYRDRAPRKNLFLAASIECGSLQAAVRVRNLSETGAMLEGPQFPMIGQRLTMRRGELEMPGVVIWHIAARCGLRFDGIISIDDWVAGKTISGSIRDQRYVDNVQAAVRAGAALPVEAQVSAAAAPGATKDLDLRIAEELAYVKRLIDSAGEGLTDDPAIVSRHMKPLQDFDLASQILSHLSELLASDDRTAALDAVTLQELRTRLMRNPMYRG